MFSQRLPGGYKARSEAEITARVRALEALLIEKGLLSAAAVNRWAEIYEREVGPRLGAKVVARAWTDSAFKVRLLADATKACEELGIGGIQGEHMVVVENTDAVHNLIVCTLCSCYPWAVLGLPPSWYKEPAYRSRIVREPRVVLRDEFGFNLPEERELRVWDSSADIRYWVLPQRPAKTDQLSEEELGSFVSRDAMLGLREPAGPKKAA